MPKHQQLPPDPSTPTTPFFKNHSKLNQALRCQKPKPPHGAAKLSPVWSCGWSLGPPELPTQPKLLPRPPLTWSQVTSWACQVWCRSSSKASPYPCISSWATGPSSPYLCCWCCSHVVIATGIGEHWFLPLCWALWQWALDPGVVVQGLVALVAGGLVVVLGLLVQSLGLFWVSPRVVFHSGLRHGQGSPKAVSTTVVCCGRLDLLGADPWMSPIGLPIWLSRHQPPPPGS